MPHANRPITSREYKLMLNTERFRDRIAGAELFWKLLTFLAKNQGMEEVPASADSDKNVEKRRTTWYLDTPGYELQRANVTVRVRDEPDAKKRFQMTLKYRASDRYTKAISDIRCTKDVDKDDVKFEEDVAPPFSSAFSYSVTFKTNDLPDLQTMADMVNLFPGLERVHIVTATPMVMVNGFQAHELLHYVGKLKLDNAPAKPARVGLNHWYLRSGESDYPLVTEFSFGYDAITADGDDDEDRLEQFSPIEIAAGNRLFRDVQSQAGWLAQFNSTKTAYVFGAT